MKESRGKLTLVEIFNGDRIGVNPSKVYIYNFEKNFFIRMYCDVLVKLPFEVALKIGSTFQPCTGS
jgi:hypothetical protein